MAKQQAAYGDVFLVQTPTLDRWSQQLYQEQRIREAKHQQENAALDAGISKDLGKVRSIDAPEIIKDYHDLKQIRKQLLFNKQLHNDPVVYNQLQQQGLQKYQDIVSKSNKSAEVKDMAKGLGSIGASDRADDYGQRINALMNTPLSQLQNHPVYGNELLDVDKYRYGGPNTNFADIVQKGIGQPKQVYSKEELMDGGLQTKITPYMYGSTPSQVKDYVLGATAMHQAGRDASWLWDHASESEKNETIKAYQALPKDYWQKIGLPGPQDLMPKNPDNKAENYASLLAMKYAIANAPKEGTPVYRENKAATMSAQEAKEKRMLALRHDYSEDEIRLRDNLKNKNESEQGDMMDELYDNVIKDARNNRMKYEPASGKPFNQYQIKATPAMKKSFGIPDGKGHMMYPDDFRLSEDGTKVTPIYLEHSYDEKGNRTEEVVKGKDNRAKVLTDLSKPILESEFKQRWKKEIMGAGAYGKTLKGGGAKNKSVSENKVEDLRKKYNY